MVDTFNIDLPVGINGVSLGEWLSYMEYYEELKGRLPKDATPEQLSELNTMMEIRMVEVFCRLDGVGARDLPFEVYDMAVSHLYDIFNEDTPLVRRFSMVGTDGVEVEFGIIPNLSKMSAGEYMDLDTYISDIRDLHKAMAVLYRPIHKSFRGKEDYRVAEYDGTDRFAEVMRDMPLGIALGAQVFFYRLGMKLSTLSMNYFLEQIDQGNLSREQRTLLQKNMDGIKAYMQWHKGMYSDLMRLRKSPSIRH